MIPDLRLIRAETLKLRRRRGMLALSLLVTAGLGIVVFGVEAIQHSANPATHGPAGGLSHYQDALTFLIAMVAVAGAIVGATAGAQDIESGVFADLAATGRSRLALFAARVPGAWAVVVPVALVTALVAATAGVTLNGSLPAPGFGTLVGGTLGLVVAGALSSTLAVGLSALVGTRGPVIGILLAGLLLISPLLTTVSFLGNLREGLPTSALDRIALVPDKGFPVGLAMAIAVTIAWAAAAFAVGAWRTTTREI